MKIHEYQAKELFSAYGIPVPAGKVATTPAEARAIAEAIGGTVAVKSQVHVGGRGKAGGIKIASDPAEAEAAASAILGMDIKGCTVGKVLVGVQDSLRGLDGYREIRRMVLVRIAHHERQSQLLTALAPEREANESSPMCRHVIDILRTHLLGSHDQIAFVFTILVIDHDDHFPGRYVADDVFDVAER